MLKAVGKIAEEFNVPAELSMDEHMCCGVGVCLMHMQGEPQTMQDAPRYGAERRGAPLAHPVTLEEGLVELLSGYDKVSVDVAACMSRGAERQGVEPKSLKDFQFRDAVEGIEHRVSDEQITRVEQQDVRLFEARHADIRCYACNTAGRALKIRSARTVRRQI